MKRLEKLKDLQAQRCRPGAKGHIAGAVTIYALVALFSLSNTACLHTWWADPDDGGITADQQQECIDNATDAETLLQCVPSLQNPVEHGPIPVNERLETEIRMEPDPNSLSGEMMAVEYECQVTDYIERENVTDITAPPLEDPADPTQPPAVNINTLWPGALVQGNSIDNGTLLPVISSRKPVVMVISNVVFGDPDAVYVKTVNNPTQARIMAAIQSFFDTSSQGSNTIAAKIKYRIKSARSFDQIEIGVRARARIDLLIASAEGQVDASSDYWFETNHVVINLTQNYFTVSFLTPETPIDVWSEAQSLSDLRKYIQPNNPPGYVASVSFGRQANLVFSSDEDSLTLSARAKATVSFLGTDVTVAEWSDSTNEQWFESDIHLISSDPKAWELYYEHITTPDNTRRYEVIEYINAYLEAGTSLTPDNIGIPISYQVRWLRNNEPARLSLAASYEESTCYAVE